MPRASRPATSAALWMDCGQKPRLGLAPLLTGQPPITWMAKCVPSRARWWRNIMTTLSQSRDGSRRPSVTGRRIHRAGSDAIRTAQVDWCGRNVPHLETSRAVVSSGRSTFTMKSAKKCRAAGATSQSPGGRRMLSFPGSLKIFIALDPCDMRAGINSAARAGGRQAQGGLTQRSPVCLHRQEAQAPQDPLLGRHGHVAFDQAAGAGRLLLATCGRGGADEAGT